MAYPFTHINREVYPKTFLKDVYVSLHFPKVDITDSLKDNMIRFFDEAFGVEDMPEESFEKVVFVHSKDDMIRFHFALEFVQFSVKQPAYRSFEQLAVYRDKAFKYLEVLKVREISKIIFYKYNQLNYQLKNSGTPVDVMKDVFSTSLLNNMTEEDVKSQTGLSRWEKSLCFQGEDATDSAFTIEYGFRKKSKDSEQDALTLKTQIESGNVNVKKDNVMAILSDYNQILDNGFHWCVTPDIIKEMKKL